MGMPSGLGLHSEHAPPLGFSEWACEPIFQTLSVAPSPCVRCAWARAVMFLVSDAISTCPLGARLVKV